MPAHCLFSLFFFFNDTATTEIYTLSLHDALPIFGAVDHHLHHAASGRGVDHALLERSEEHTSELQSHSDLVCRLLLEKKKKQQQTNPNTSTHRNTETHTLTPTH